MRSRPSLARQFNDLIYHLSLMFIVFQIAYILSMRLGVKSQTAGVTASLVRVQHKINMNKVVLQWQKGLGVFLDRHNDLLSHWVAKLNSKQSKMLPKETGHSLQGELCVDELNIVSADEKIVMEEELGKEIEEFNAKVVENVELLKKTLADSRLVGMGYAFLITKEKSKLKEIENEIENEKQEEWRYRMLLNRKWTLLLPNTGTEKVLLETHGEQAARLKRYDKRTHREQLEISRITETILMLDCIHQQQVKELHVVEKLIAYMDTRIYDRKNILNSLLDENGIRSDVKDLEHKIQQNTLIYTDDKNNDSKRTEEYKSSSEINIKNDLEYLNTQCLEFMEDQLPGENNFRRACSKWTSKLMPWQPVIKIPIIDYPMVRKSGTFKNAPRALGRLRRTTSCRAGSETIYQTLAVAV